MHVSSLVPERGSVAAHSKTLTHSRDLKIPRVHRFTCIGTAEENVFKAPQSIAELPETRDEEDVSCEPDHECTSPKR